ncbi:MAG: DNA-binding protein [Fibrobacter sp.]|mgnify:CR=1 FL=1|nr:DNA-binding protein [Fibrobacter sp.]
MLKEKMYHVGNLSLLTLPKVAFLCSRSIAATAVLKCYDWVIEQRGQGKCIISGFQSQIEKDVLHYLLQGKQPLVIALSRGIKVRLEPELQQAISQNRLLIITTFPDSIKRPTVDTSQQRNRMMIEMADEVVFGYVKVGGELEKLKTEYEKTKKMIIL